jgi:hypothetical protein
VQVPFATGGLTGISKESFPVWIVPIFLWFYPFWFIAGYELAKKYTLGLKIVPLLIIGIVLLAVPSVVESLQLIH